MTIRITKTLGVLLVLLIAAVAFAGYALARKDGGQSVTSGPLAPEADNSEGWGACTLYKHGSDVRVTYTGSAPYASCTEIASKWSASGDYWTQDAATPFGTLVPVCSLTRDDIVMTVEDSGSQFYGSSICANLTAAGFH
jgi:hypothetical protein